jgi:predicted porin
MKKKYLLGVASAALSIAMMSSGAWADPTLDAVMKRLDALEKSNSKLAKENAELRDQVREIKGRGMAAPAAAPVATDPAKFKGNPVLHGAVATSPAPAPVLTVGGKPIVTKASPLGALVDNTTVTIYGHGDLSLDVFNVGVFDQGTKLAVASNGSYFGIRARHNLTPYGYPGWSFVLQYEEQIDAAAVPTERAAFGSRDSFLGVEGPYGAIKLGKGYTPYQKATAVFDPFANTVGDYNSIMGNTGGDNRAEFDWRAPHAIWYESPIWQGLQFSAMVSPGQNYAKDNSDFAYGDFNCPGSTPRGTGSGFWDPNIGTGKIAGFDNECTDGSYGNLYSAALTYKNGPFTAMAAYELHEKTNRHGDDGLEPGYQFAPVFLPDGSQVFTGVHNEWAVKVGGGYQFKDPLGPLQLYAYYEWLRRDVGAFEQPFNERSRDGVFASATQFLGEHWSLSASYAHAFKTPGNPATLSPNNTSAYGPPFMPAGPGVVYQANLFDDSASQYAVGTKYRFNQWASWYLVGAVITQGAGAHYCLGPSGHAFQFCSRDQNNDTIGGATIKAISSGLTFDF